MKVTLEKNSDGMKPDDLELGSFGVITKAPNNPLGVVWCVGTIVYRSHSEPHNLIAIQHGFMSLEEANKTYLVKKLTRGEVVRIEI